MEVSCYCLSAVAYTDFKHGDDAVPRCSMRRRLISVKFHSSMSSCSNEDPGLA